MMRCVTREYPGEETNAGLVSTKSEALTADAVGCSKVLVKGNTASVVTKPVLGSEFPGHVVPDVF